MQTYTGHKFWPLDPQPEHVFIEDIAHALGMLCRYNGHCNRFYSVAEHSIFVSRALPSKLRLAGLLHDAAEAYISDLIRPVKPYIKEYKRIEQNILSVIVNKYHCYDESLDPEIKVVDLNILKDEQEQAMGAPPEKWYCVGKGLGVELQFWNPTIAEKIFFHEFKRVRHNQTLHPIKG